jgi:thiazole/oxazole-forming peptide maturase SagC family component
MKKYPKIFENLRILESPKNELFFIGKKEKIIIKGSSVGLVKKNLPYLNGKNSGKDIASNVKIPVKLIKQLLKLLKENNLVYFVNKKETDEAKKFAFTKELISFFKQKELDPFECIKNIKNSSLALINAGKIGSNVLNLLQSIPLRKIKIFDDKKVTHSDIELGIYSKANLNELRCTALRKIFSNVPNLQFFSVTLKNVIKKQLLSDTTAVIFTSDEPESDKNAFELLNKYLLKINKNWISCRLYNGFGEIGPTILPYKTACFHCYEIRRASTAENLEEYMSIRNAKIIKREETGNLKSSVLQLSCVTVTEIIKLLSKKIMPITCNSFLTIDFNNYETHLHPVLKLPNCPFCGNYETEV